MPPIRTLQQRYWFSPQFPFLECRSTWQSRQPYKVHSHAQLSVGCLERGSTQCRVGEQTCLLNAGDVVVIPPGLPHSCNPLPGKTRRYHRCTSTHNGATIGSKEVIMTANRSLVTLSLTHLECSFIRLCR
ncbi:AraC family ligand binding domain-containing protein [Lonsdalea quercina]|uniref:AraC family ligand binding domain-containing protein n=1 Tax=Lonsdalea quercina TaxID=71657 RepID=UPI003974D86B